MDQALPPTVWPIGLLLAALAAEAGLLRVGIDDLDEGYFVQQATRVLAGQVPYRDFETLYTPGLAYVHAALFAALGGPSLVGERALALLARAGIVLLLFALAQPHVRNPWWAAAPGLVVLLGLDDAPVRWEPHPGWWSTLFALLAVWCLAHPPRGRWSMAGGAAAGLSYVFKQNTGAFILLAILIWSGRGCLARPLAGFGTVTLVWLVPLVLAMGGQLARLGVIVGAVNQAGLLSPPEPTLILPLAAAGAGLWLVRRDSDPRLRWSLLAGGALLLTEVPRMDTLHLVWSAPLLLALGAIALDRVPPRVVWPSLAILGALLAPTLSSRLAYLAEPRAPIAGVEAAAPTAAELAALVADVQQRTAPGQPIFVYPTSPLVYVLADRPNPTRFDHLNPGAADPAQLQEVIDDLQRAGVRLVVISEFWESAWGPPGPNAPLEAWLVSHFREAGRHGAYRVLLADL